MENNILPATRTDAAQSHTGNNFGFLRLFFAAMVVLGHSPELVDGNRLREPLTQLFGTLSFGELAVDGFFLISGYLITSSFQRSYSSYSYLRKRILRIYPGYIAAYLISLVVVAPWAGEPLLTVAAQGMPKLLFDMVTLQPPRSDGAFAGSAYPLLNGSMWTLSYEFRCYIAVMLLGALGVLRRPKLYLAIAALFVAATPFHIQVNMAHHYSAFTGEPEPLIRFFAMFLCGGAYYLLRDRVRYSAKGFVAALAALALLLFIPKAASAAVATLGGYVLFCFAFKARLGWLGKIGNKTDISYGLYLYAWPVQCLLIWYIHGISPLLVFLIAAPIAAGLGFASWHLAERPVLQWKGSLLPGWFATPRRRAVAS